MDLTLKLSPDRNASVGVCIVTHNSATEVPACLQAIGDLQDATLELVIVDCDSGDGSLRAVEDHAPNGVNLTAIPLSANLGFAGGMNRAIRSTTASLILALNPDTRPTPDFLTQLVARMQGTENLRVGAVTGRLVRPTTNGAPLLDAAGMRLTMTWRHLDRGSNRPDDGQFDRLERVFGATGAATLYRREALEDVALDGEYFLEEFHSYREDAELCFRFQERGWDVLYEPTALAEHVRRNLPQKRRSMSALINYHSLKNRYLLRAYHQTFSNFVITGLPTLFRDVAILLYVALKERSSLPAYRWLWDRRRFILQRRRTIQDRKTTPNRRVNRWFFRQGQEI